MNDIQFNQQQAEAISHMEGPMVVLSVAGSGKTLVLTERIIRLIENGVNPSRLLAITFAKKAVLEIQSRIKKRLNGIGSKALICTFHSLGFRILKAEDVETVGFRLVQDAEQDEVISEAMKMVKVEDDPPDMMRRISLAKNDLVSPKDLETSEVESIKQLAKVYSAYELLKRRARSLDFDDLLYLPYQLLSSNEDILEQYQRRFQHILIDEFQDSSRVMVEIVRMLSRSHRNIWVAGDDDQTIHGFRGARSDIFVSFAKDYEDGKTITMSHNYRSTRNIIEAANRLIRRNKKRVPKQMITDNEDGVEVQVLQGDNETAEADIIANTIMELADHGYHFGEIAVLARLYRIMPFIKGALIRMGIPYNSFGEFFYDRLEIRTAIAAMRYLLTGVREDKLKLEFLSAIRTKLYGNEALNLKSAFSIAFAYTVRVRQEKYLDEEARALRRLYLETLEQLVSPYEDFNGFLAHMEEARSINKSSGRNRVTLMTIHQAKGLEFKCVIVPGLNEGILPHIHSIEGLANMEEERRLMYVAMTRAMERLVITCLQHREGQTGISQSRFLKEFTDAGAYHSNT